MTTLIIPFYDRDVNLIPAVVKNLQEINYQDEVLFIDDRADKSKTLNFGPYKSIGYEGNKNLFYARRFGVLHAKGDYIRFADMDDHIRAIRFRPFDADMIYYNWTVEGKKRNCQNTTVFTGAWAVVFKKELLLKVYAEYPAFEGFFAREDYFLLAACHNHYPKCKYETKQIIYDYNGIHDTAALKLLPAAEKFMAENLLPPIDKRN